METVPAPLKGKVAVVTGGSRGIGAGTALKLAQQGCSHIAITYVNNQNAADKMLSSIKDISPKIKTCAVQANLLDPDFGPKVVKQAMAGLEVDHLDIVISNAAPVSTDKMIPAHQMTKEDFDYMITGNAWAPFSLAQASISHMAPGGRIIMISSGSSKIAFGDPSIAYAAGKAALDAISRNLAAAWGVKYSITVNSISVGATLTDAMEHAFESWGDEHKKVVESFALLKRIASVDEVANIIAFVASPQAQWIHGMFLVSCQCGSRRLCY